MLHLPGTESATVFFEDRAVTVRDGRLADDFGPYGVHIYAAADSAIARSLAGTSF